MKILIDADGCPVVKETLAVGNKHKLNSVIVCDSAHIFDASSFDDKVSVITVEKGRDSADFRLLSLCEKGDLVITQDYGLASMCLSKGVRVLNQDGFEYTNDNIDGLLFTRYISKKERDSGKRIKGPKKRDSSKDVKFLDALEKIILEINS